MSDKPSKPDSRIAEPAERWGSWEDAEYWRKQSFLARMPAQQRAPEQSQLDTAALETEVEEADEPATATTAPAKSQPWPKDAVEQVRAVADALAASPAALSLDDIAARFTARGPWKKRLPQLLDMLVALGRAKEQDGRYAAGRG